MEPPKHAQERAAAAPFFSGIGPGHYLFKPRPQALHGGTPAGAGLFRRHVPDFAPFGAPPGATQDSIANHLFIDKCNVARRTKKLETLGYLYRETNQNDRPGKPPVPDGQRPGAGAHHPGIFGPVGALHHRGLDGHRVRGAVSPSDQDDRPGPKVT